MNRYFENNDQYISNKRIFEAYFTEKTVAPSPAKKMLDSLLSVLLSILAILSGSVAKRLYRVGAVAACMIGFVGMIGAVERGTLSMGVAFLIGIALLGIEIICLKKHR